MNIRSATAKFKINKSECRLLRSRAAKKVTMTKPFDKDPMMI